MRIKEEDIHKTTFKARYDHYKFVVVPFGLTNALASFMCLMNGVLHPYLEKFVIVIVDGICVYSRTKEEHEKHLVVVLQLLIEHKLYAKLSKCDFFWSQIHYIGHIISEEGVLVYPKKIQAIRERPTPKNMDEFRSFMGLAGYYRRFIQYFSKTDHPITTL